MPEKELISAAPEECALISLDRVGLRYPVYDVSSRSIKINLLRALGNNRVLTNRRTVEIQALKNVSMTIRRGQRVGLIGPNGSGKSTLLRVIAGLAYPQEGRLRVTGSLATIIDRGLGINPELSGFDNIQLPLRLLGASDAEVVAAQKEIPAWASLGDFIHMPFRTYSEGMKARLMFAICTAVKRDIFILDEWLSAGDADFVQKSHDRMIHYLNTTGTVVLASHNNDIIRWICDTAIWLDGGHIVRQGPAGEVLDAYLEHSARATAANAAVETPNLVV